MSVKVKLTGRTRHRVHNPLFGAQIMVLQVEVHREGYIPDGWGYGNTVDRCEWRDAKPEDVTTKEPQ